MFLTQTQLEELTGYRRPSGQKRWLGENGVQYFVNAEGRVIVQVDALSKRRIQSMEPDFSQFNVATINK